jgi:Xaa-Pro aminopeptidase
MYPHQAERLTAALERAGADALVATSPGGVAYITGFRGLTGAAGPAPRLAVFTRQGTALVVPAADAVGIVVEAVPVDHVVGFGEFRPAFGPRPSPEVRRVQAIAERFAAGPADALARALAELGIRSGSVGLDESGLAHEDWRHLQDGLAGVKVIAAAGHLAEARRVKAPYEIECLGQALHVAEEALDVVIQAIDRGMTEREAATLYAAEVLKRGAWPYPALVAMGERAAIPAPSPTDRALGRGDFVRFDVGCVHKGYCASVGRTAVLGPPTPAQEAAHAAIQAGLDAAIAAVRAGAAAGRVREAAVAAVRAAGLPEYECAHVGHGIGLDRAERPALAAGGETPLEMGEVLRIETPYYEIGAIGIGVTGTVLVTSAGARVLNRSHAGLIVLD